jgi:DNA-binding MarR family transcriptional regulator
MMLRTMSPRAPTAPPAAPLRVDCDFEDEFPGASASATECVINLVRTAQLVLAEMDRRRRTVADLSAAAAQILAVVEGAGEPLTPKVIARRMLVTTGTMTSILNTLERRGLIRRVPHPTDNRQIHIAITPRGRRLVDEVLPRVHGAEREMIAVLDEAEREQLVQLLARVQSRLGQLLDRPVALGRVQARRLADQRPKRRPAAR